MTRRGDGVRDAQAYYEPRVDAYRTSRDHRKAEDLARMLQWLDVTPGERALDVATGGGATAEALRDAGCRVTPLDATRGFLGVHGVEGDAAALPFRGDAFDVVACRIAAHHFPDLAGHVAEAARVLRTGGRYYAFDLTTPEDPEVAAWIDDTERLRDPSHVRSWPPSAWRHALDAAGLVIRRLEGGASLLDLDAWVARAALPHENEAALRARLASPRGGYGATPDARMRVLRVEVLATKP